MMWGFNGDWSMMYWMFFWSFIWLAFLGVIIWAVARWIVVSTSSGKFQASPSMGPSAMELLQRRYAQGEIDTPTFEQMSERLRTSTEVAHA